MRFLPASLRAALIAFSVATLGASRVPSPSSAPVRPVTDTYFGTSVVDPYRYMESGDPAYRAWLVPQALATAKLLAAAREGFAATAPAAPAPQPAERITDLAFGGGRVFYEAHSGAGDRLVVRDLHGGASREIVTDRTYAPDGTASLGAFALSNDAKTIELHVSVGKTISDVHVLRVEGGHDVEPPLHDSIFDYVGFTPDDRAVLYAKSTTPSTDYSIPGVTYDYLHRLGTEQRNDTIVFGRGVSPLVDVPQHSFAFVDTTAEPQALAEVRDVAAGGSRFFAAPIAAVGKPNTPWRPLGTASAGYTDEAIHGATVDLVTSANAPNYAVVRARLDGTFTPTVVLPASDSVVVSGTLDGIPKAGIFALYAAADADYVQLLDRGVSRLVRIPYDATARPTPVELPLSGSILEVATDQHARGALVHVTSWTSRGDVYAYDPDAGKMMPLDVVSNANEAPRVAEELTATAPDGTSIPLSVVHRPGIALDGTHPLILRVAGAYGFSLTPDYRSVPDGWLERGGIYAVAHVRGGGELGEAWHRAGMGEHKENTWVDLIAAAQRLIDAGYTAPRRLHLYSTTQSYLGGVASGIAIGRALEERPDLFGAAVIDAPIFDMLRSERTPIGHQSVSEFGSTETVAGFEALRAMSPYEHVRDGVRYPPVLVRSFSSFGLGDDWQAAKMVARLQAAAGRDDAAYLDIVDDARSRAQVRSDALAFFLYEDGAR